jgi:hypothetical protein
MRRMTMHMDEIVFWAMIGMAIFVATLVAKGVI